MSRSVIAAFSLLAAVAWSTPADAVEITKGPFLQKPAPDRMLIVWEQDEASAPVVRFGEDDGYGQEVAAEAPATRHEILVEGLEPGTRYHYGVFDGAEALSQDAAFWTPVEPGESFRFVVFGDTRNRHEVHQAVADAIEAEEPRFVIQTGDLVADGEVQEQWDEYFRIEQSLMSQVPVFPVIGNHDEHDGAAELYIEHFVLPDDSPHPEHYYSFEYGNVHVVVLDSHVNVDPWPICIEERDLWIDACFHPEQEAWLKEDIQAAKANPDIDHVFVAIHIGPFSSKEGRSGNAQMRRILPWLEGMGVTAIFSGHDHYYERGAAANGMPYAITGGGGAPLYEIGEPSWGDGPPNSIAYNESIENYIVADVDGDTVSFTAKTPDGRVLDEFEVTSRPECETDAECADAEPPAGCDPPGFCSAGRHCAFDCEMEGGGRSEVPRLPSAQPEPQPEAAEAAPDAGGSADVGGSPDAGGEVREDGSESTDDAGGEPGPGADSGAAADASDGGSGSDDGCQGGGLGAGWPVGAALVFFGWLVLGVARRRTS